MDSRFGRFYNCNYCSYFSELQPKLIVTTQFYVHESNTRSSMNLNLDLG